MILLTKDIYGNELHRPIQFVKNIDNISDYFIEVLGGKCAGTIKNSSYIEYNAKANTKVIIQFMNKTEY